MRKRLFRSATIIALSLFSVGSLASCDNTSSTTSSSEAATKALVEITTNGHGTVSVANLDSDNKATLNTLYTVTTTPDSGYRLDAVNVNGTDITAALSFTPTDATVNYIVNATFVADVNPGKTSLKLTGNTGVEVGKTMQLSTTVYGPNASVTYASSDKTIATVDQNGLVTGVKAGFVTVTATSVLSTEKDPVTSSFTFFVEPSYIARMVEGFKSYDYGTGLSFTGSFALAFGPGSVEKPDSAQIRIPYTFSMKENADATTLLSSTNFNLSLSFDSSTTMILYFLSSPLKIDGLMTAKRIDISYLGDGNLTFVGYTPVTTGDGDTATTVDEICFLKETSISTLLSSLVAKLLPIIPSLSSIIPTGDSSSTSLSSINIGSLLSVLNSVLVFDTDATKGISLAPAIVTTLQSYLTEYLKSMTDSEDEYTKSMGTILTAILPSDLQDIRFIVNLNADNTFNNIAFTIKDSKKSDDTAVTYKFIDFSLGKSATALSANFFSDLNTSYASAKADNVILDTVNTMKAAIDTDLNGAALIPHNTSSHSRYDAIHFNSNFTTDLTTFRDTVNGLSDSKSENYITNQSMISSSLIESYLPFCSFDVFKGDDTANALPDGYTVKVGDTFKIANYTVAGDSTYEALEVKPDFTDMRLSSNAVKKTTVDNVTTTTEFVTYDKTTQTVTIKALPEKESVVTLSTKVPSDYTGKYTSLSYNFLLPAAAVVA